MTEYILNDRVMMLKIQLYRYIFKYILIEDSS